jgi:protein PhnA
MDEPLMQWAQASQENTQKTLDSNGVELQAGDSVSIIKDLEVKGAGFTAKRGTTVKNISLTNNPEQIEGRVNGVKIVLLSKFLKKV